MPSDPDTTAAAIEPHIPALRRYAWALLREREAADDLVQDCLERAVSRWHLRRRDADLRAWLFAIQRNLFVSGLRSHNRRGGVAGLDEAADQPSPEAAPDRHLMARDALTLLGHLPEEQRSLLLLVGVEDLSYGDAARVFGVPVGTIMSRLSRARERLRRLIDQGEPVALRRVK